MQIFICLYKFMIWSINNYVEELITSETELKVDTINNEYVKVSEHE